MHYLISNLTKRRKTIRELKQLDMAGGSVKIASRFNNYLRQNNLHKLLANSFLTQLMLRNRRFKKQHTINT